MKYNPVFYIIIILALSCQSTPERANDLSAAPLVETDRVSLPDSMLKTAGIETGPVNERRLNASLRVNGTVDVPPQNIVSVSFPMGGYLKSTKLLPGMHINRGEVIAWMEDQSLIQLQQEFLVARTRLDYLQKELQRQQVLRNHEVNAAKTLQQVEADYESQKVVANALGQKLRLIGLQPEQLNSENIFRSIPVYSPINGFVSKVNVNIGKFVNPADVLFELINPDDMHASLTVFEKDMPNVHMGQRVLVNFVDDPGTTYICEIILVTRNVDENRSGTVHCHFETRPRNLLPGMFLNAAIETESRSCRVVPEAAVVRYGDSEYIFVREGSGFRLVPVQTGIREGEWVELQQWPDSLMNQQVVYRNAYTLLGSLKNKAE